MRHDCETRKAGVHTSTHETTAAVLLKDTRTNSDAVRSVSVTVVVNRFCLTFSHLFVCFVPYVYVDWVSLADETRRFMSRGYLGTLSVPTRGGTPYVIADGRACRYLFVNGGKVSPLYVSLHALPFWCLMAPFPVLVRVE